MTLTDLLPILGGIIAFAVGLIRILEILIRFLIKKLSKQKDEIDIVKEIYAYIKDGNKSILTIEERDQLNLLHNLHNKFDENGVPVWYDRSIISSHNLLEIIDKVNENQIKMIELVQTVVAKNETHNNK